MSQTTAPTPVIATNSGRLVRKHRKLCAERGKGKLILLSTLNLVRICFMIKQVYFWYLSPTLSIDTHTHLSHVPPDNNVSNHFLELTTFYPRKAASCHLLTSALNLFSKSSWWWVTMLGEGEWGGEWGRGNGWWEWPCWGRKSLAIWQTAVLCVTVNGQFFHTHVWGRYYRDGPRDGNSPLQ